MPIAVAAAVVFVICIIGMLNSDVTIKVEFATSASEAAATVQPAEAVPPATNAPVNNEAVTSTPATSAPAVLYGLTKSWAKKHNAYMWLFERMLPGDDKGAWHSSDLWYWFGTLKNCWRPMTEEDYKISDTMSTYLCNFVKTGKPDEGDKIAP